jgi:glycosyltransferase involved in cell wall biosynthesis
MNDLFVTFPVDLGNRSIEANLQHIFKDDFDFYRFAAQHANELDRGVNYKRNFYDRLFSVREFRGVVKRYAENNKKIIFNGLSPALWSYGVWDGANVTIAFDWTRLLYPSVLKKKIKKDVAFYLHKMVFKKCSKILCWTDAVMLNLIDCYGVDDKKLVKVQAPLLVGAMDIRPRKTPEIPRVLFVGGNIDRKGGDIILQKYKHLLEGRCHLTMMTSKACGNCDGITWEIGVKYGTSQHRKIYESNDILILPTKIDAYPQVLGEAAAAGLAIVTTRFALGATEVISSGVTGYIADSPEEAVEYLGNLIKNTTLIDQFKSAGYAAVHEKFNEKKIRDAYLREIF